MANPIPFCNPLNLSVQFLTGALYRIGCPKCLTEASKDLDISPPFNKSIRVTVGKHRILTKICLAVHVRLHPQAKNSKWRQPING